MNNIDDIYKVSRDEYVGFVSQINPAHKKVIVDEKNPSLIKVYTYSKDERRLFAARFIKKDEDEVIEEEYYAVEMPHIEERQAPKKVQTITLESKEEVQAFFDILNSQKKKND